MAYAMEEPANLFIDANNQTRPDIRVDICKNMVTTRYALDLTLICPFKGAGKGDLKIGANGNPRVQGGCDARAKTAAGYKATKFAQPCQQRNLVFVPIVMYTTGKIHEDGYKFLQQLAAHGEERRRIPKNVLLKYYLKLLSVCLVKRVSYTICTRAAHSFARNYNIRGTFRTGNALANWNYGVKMLGAYVGSDEYVL
jgi:hypothetical protein